MAKSYLVHTNDVQELNRVLTTINSDVSRAHGKLTIIEQNQTTAGANAGSLTPVSTGTIILSGDVTGSGTSSISTSLNNTQNVAITWVSVQTFNGGIIGPAFTSVAAGLTPASGGGTTNFLRADGTWAPTGGGGGTLTPRVAVADANYSVVATQDVIVAYTSITAARTVALDAASVAAGQQITIIDESGNVSSTNTITVNRAGSDLIEGQTSYVLQRPFTAITFISNGSNGWSIRRSQLKMQTFNANGSWVCPPGVQVAWLLMCGAGGGGSGASNAYPALGSNGGAGGQIFNAPIGVVPGTSYTITLGAGGTGGAYNTKGNNGGNTTFGSLATAYGGQGAPAPNLWATGNAFTSGLMATGYTVTSGFSPNTCVLAYPDNRLGAQLINVPSAVLGAGGVQAFEPPPGCGGLSSYLSGAGGMNGGPTAFAAGGAAAVGNGSGSNGGSGGGASLGAGANGGAQGAVGSSAAANTGGGGGGGGATGSYFAGGAGGSGVCTVFWIE